MYRNPLKKTVEYLKGCGPERAKTLQAELGIFRYEDLLNHFPFRYIDRSKYYTIREIRSTAAEIQLKGQMVAIQEIKQGKVNRLVAKFQDGTGTIELIWFKVTKWQREKLQGDLFKELVVYGKLNEFNGHYSIVHPEIDTVEDAKKIPQGLFPVYSSTEMLQKKGITNRILQKMVAAVFAEQISIPENIPQHLIDHFKLMSREQAYKTIHFPQNLDDLKRAENRLKFEEFFFLNLSVLSKKIQNKAKNRAFAFPMIGDYFNTFYKERMPFELTGAQKRVIKEIRSDLKHPAQMNRFKSSRF